MLEILQKYESGAILNILDLDNSHFKSLDVDYHPPRVERIGINTGNYRIYFHVLHPCNTGESLYHSHPWKSAIHVLSGNYEMGLSYCPNSATLPDMESGIYNEVRSKDEICKIYATQGMYYEMNHPDGWHYVRPVGPEPCYSTMIIGDLLYKGAKAPRELKELSDQRITEIKEWFYNHYYNNTHIYYQQWQQKQK
jgi:hypothetical protein